jgi:hypothetical protein
MTSPTPPPDPGPVVYGRDGRLLDPYHLLDRNAPPFPAGSRAGADWAQRDRDIARDQRQTRAEVIAAAAGLDPADTSPAAEHLREVADQARDHTEDDNRRIAWAVAALRADPTLAGLLPPSVLDAAAEHLPALDPAWGAGPAPEPGASEVPPGQASIVGDQGRGPDPHRHDVAQNRALGDAELVSPQASAEPAGPQAGGAALDELPELGL